MRISDWSSDVCSSDLDRLAEQLALGRVVDCPRQDRLAGGDALDCNAEPLLSELGHQHGEALAFRPQQVVGWHPYVIEEEFRRVLRLQADLLQVAATLNAGRAGVDSDQADALGAFRSEEHTSELQSLMRSSYAVFCLKKKKK